MRRWFGRVLDGGVRFWWIWIVKGLRVESGMAKKVHQAIVNSLPDKQQHELQAGLLKLFEACPFDETNPKDCPLFSLRKIGPCRRLQWFDALTEDDLGYLAAYHHVCFTIRVASRLAE